MKSYYVNDQEQITPEERNLTAEHQIQEACSWPHCSSTGGPCHCNIWTNHTGVILSSLEVDFFSGWLTHAYLWCKIFGASHHAPLPSRLNAVLSVLIWFKFPGGQMTLLSVSTQQTYSNHIAITIWLWKAWSPVNGKISTKLLLLLYHHYPTSLEQRKAGHTVKEFTRQVSWAASRLPPRWQAEPAQGPRGTVPREQYPPN